MAASRTFFTKKLLQWWQIHKRDLPWKKTKDPYIIWLSEIILQQTRVKQGLPYFEKFVKAYPNVGRLANAPEDEVMRLWEGLGYYSRARNMHWTARYIHEELGGVFPQSYKEIIQLKGVGPYTAAAIASFAYDLPHAVIDGNVYRVLSRFFGIETPIDSTEGKKEFARLAAEVLDKKKSAAFNQAIMDFGSLQCKPQNPACTACPLQKKCVAFNQDRIQDLPVKSKKIKRKERFFNYLVLWNEKKQVCLQKRTGKDIWQNLYQFPLIESQQKLLNKEGLLQNENWSKLFDMKKPKPSIKLSSISPSYQQLLTHQKINACFFEIYINTANTPSVSRLLPDTVWLAPSELKNYACPKIINRFIEDYLLNEGRQLQIDW